MSKKTRKKKTVVLPAWMRMERRYAWGLLLLAVALYANTLFHDYTQDDAIVIYDNEFVTKGIAGIGDIFAYDTFRGFFKVEGKADLVSGGRYRPLTLVMFAVEWSLFGRSPFIGHLLNVLLYGISCFLLYKWMSTVAGKKYKPMQAIFVAMVASLIFTVHPLHTEAVANIKGRDEIMSLLFGLLALMAALKTVKNEGIIWAVLSGAFVFLGLLSKETAVAFVPLIPLCIWYVNKNMDVKNVLTSALPALIGFGAYMTIRMSILDLPDPTAEAPRELMNNPFLKLEGGRWVDFSFSEWSATVTFTLGKYLQLFVFPHPLTHDYYPRHVDIMQWTDWRVLLSLAANLALLTYAIRSLFNKDLAGYGLWFYFLTLFPVSNIMLPVGTNLSERFMFAPSVGLSLAVAILLYRLVTRHKKVSAKQLKPIMIAVLLVSALLAVKTFTRNAIWKDNYTLFTTDVNTSQNSAKLLNGAGGVMVDSAQHLPQGAQRTEMLNQAKEYLRKAVEIHPTYNNAYLLLGNAHQYSKDYEQAIAAYKHVLTYNPDYELAQKNLRIAYRAGGQYYGEEKGDLQKALTYLREAEKMDPNDYETVRLLGVALGVKGNSAEAIKYFRRTTELQPENAWAWWNLGVALMQSGDQLTGQQYIEKARSMDPKVGQQ